MNNLNSQASALRATFLKAQTAAALATALDFAVYVILVELASVWYVLAAAIGALCGAVSNFLLGRHWCFDAHAGHVYGQAWRYAWVSGLSLLLNTGGVYLLADGLGLHYLASRVLIAIVVAVLFNYPLQRFYVFK